MKRQVILYAAIAIVLCAVAAWVGSARTDLLAADANYGDFILSNAAESCYGGTTKSEYWSELDSGLGSADIIVRARFTGARQAMYQSTLSAVEVLHVYQGDAAIQGATIAVYERNFFSARDGQLTYHAGALENLMIAGDEYYLFLSALAVPRAHFNDLPEYTPDWAWSELAFDLPCLIPCARVEGDVAIVSADEIRAGAVRFADVADAHYIVADAIMIDEINARDQYVKDSFHLT